MNQFNYCPPAAAAAKLIRLQKMVLFGDTVLKEKEKTCSSDRPALVVYHTMRGQHTSNHDTSFSSLVDPDDISLLQGLQPRF